MPIDAEQIRAILDAYGNALGDSIARHVVAAIEAHLADRQLAPAKEWYSVEEFAAAVNRSPLTIRQRWLPRKIITASKDRLGRLRIARSEVERILGQRGS